MTSGKRRCQNAPLRLSWRAISRRFACTRNKVTDRDIEELKEAGFSEDEIFEQTVSVAVAAGLERLDAGLGTLG